MSTEDGASEPTFVEEGREFKRDTNYIPTRITEDGRDGYPVEPGRYRLIVARACPWANRAIIVRRLLGLEDVLSMGICGPVHDKRSWTFDLDPGGVDPVLKIPRLQDAYFARDPHYPRGITVPAMVEIATGKVITNDYPQITLDFSTQWKKYHREGAPDLYPEPLRNEIDEVAEYVFRDVNNGVYRCGFRRFTAGLRRGIRHAVRSPRLAHRTSCPATFPGGRTPSPKPMCACSPRWRGSIPSITATSSATEANSARCRCCGTTRAICSRPPDSVTPSTSHRSKRTTTSCIPRSIPQESCPRDRN